MVTMLPDMMRINMMPYCAPVQTGFEKFAGEMTTSSPVFLVILVALWFVAEFGVWATQQVRRWWHNYHTPPEMQQVWSMCRQGNTRGLHPDLPINHPTFDMRWTCLHMALEGKHVELVYFLLRNYPQLDCNVADARGRSPIDMAFSHLACYKALVFDPRTLLAPYHLHRAVSEYSVEHLELILAAMGSRGWRGPCPVLTPSDDILLMFPRAREAQELATHFNTHPQKTIGQLLGKFRKPTREGALLALVLFCCDELISFSEQA